jgi:hypothetical protein
MPVENGGGVSTITACGPNRERFRVEIRDRSAHRMADQDRAQQAEVVDETCEVIAHQLKAVEAGSGTCAVAPLVESDDTPTVGECDGGIDPVICPGAQRGGARRVALSRGPTPSSGRAVHPTRLCIRLGHAPPSMRSRSRSGCPLWRAYSSIMWTYTQRICIGVSRRIVQLSSAGSGTGQLHLALVGRQIMLWIGGIDIFESGVCVCVGAVQIRKFLAGNSPSKPDALDLAHVAHESQQ